MSKKEVPIGVLMQYFRVPTGDIPVDYAGRDVLFGSGITNISTTGAFIRTNKPLPKDTSLEFVFRLPESSHDIRAIGVVRWSAGSDSVSADAGSPVGMGIEFTRLVRRDKRAIERFVRHFLARMRGLADKEK